jgi:S-adenosylmethionine:tRNA ribosyltransferase-isomerase
MRSADFDYELPASAIAQRPTARRDACRLAAVDRSTGRVEHTRFSELGRFLRPGDLLVLNDSRVLPARVPCRRESSGGAVEFFLLDPLAPADDLPALLKAGGRLRTGETLLPLRAPRSGRLRLRERREDGSYRLAWEGSQPWGEALLQRLGLPPLPPYIRRPKLPESSQRRKDLDWYQTVYAAQGGSVAAPTAGLHFTAALLRRLQAQGIGVATVTLHVGAGTFQPVKTERLEDHIMHTERCRVPPNTAQLLQRTRQAGGRIIAVGTTVLRTLESARQADGTFRTDWFETQLFLKPGDSFHVVNALLTNFHQPRSTLLPLVAAFWDKDRILAFYRDCIQRGYRFLSYGDACFFY